MPSTTAGQAVCRYKLVSPGGMKGQLWALAAGDMAQNGERVFVVLVNLGVDFRLIKEKSFGGQEHLLEALGQRLKIRICDQNRLHTLPFSFIRRKIGLNCSGKFWVIFWWRGAGWNLWGDITFQSSLRDDHVFLL